MKRFFEKLQMRHAVTEPRSVKNNFLSVNIKHQTSNIMKMKSKILVLVGLITFGTVGANRAAEPQKPDCPTPFQIFHIDAFTEAEAIVLWPTGADAYASQADAAVDYPDRSLEAFFWSNVAMKEGALEALQLVDNDGDGVLCMKYIICHKHHDVSLYADYDPLYLFIFGEKGR